MVWHQLVKCIWFLWKWSFYKLCLEGGATQNLNRKLETGGIAHITGFSPQWFHHRPSWTSHAVRRPKGLEKLSHISPTICAARSEISCDSNWWLESFPQYGWPFGHVLFLWWEEPPQQLPNKKPRGTWLTYQFAKIHRETNFQDEVFGANSLCSGALCRQCRRKEGQKRQRYF